MNNICLVVSQDQNLADKLAVSLKKEGHIIARVCSSEEAVQELGKRFISSIFADKNLFFNGEQAFVKTVNGLNTRTKIVFFNSTDQVLNFWSMEYYNFSENEPFSNSFRELLESKEYSTKNILEKMAYTSKQVQILLMIAKGEGNKSIAQDLGISEQGVKYHVGILLKSFKVTNRKQLQKILNSLN